MKTTTDDIAALSYEEARDELIAIVAKLETGSATLDESLGLWERGEALAARCQELLDGARDRITETRGDADAGVVGIVPQEAADDAVGTFSTGVDGASTTEEDDD